MIALERITTEYIETEDRIRLTGEAAGGVPVVIWLPLRQWLGILHDMYVKAEWPLAVWPDWVRESALSRRPERCRMGAKNVFGIFFFEGIDSRAIYIIKTLETKGG